MESGLSPPTTILVHGSPSSGKSTVITSLLKHYTKHKVTPKGPITIRTSKYNRVTFVESGQDIGSQQDLFKVADLVLLVIDGSVGFEMETFEALSMMKQIGFSSCMGVVTHMDFFKENKQMRA